MSKTLNKEEYKKRVVDERIRSSNIIAENKQKNNK